MSIAVLQINLNHSRAATALLATYLKEKQLDIALIQDPYCFNGRLCGFPNWPAFHSLNKNAWIVICRPTLTYCFESCSTSSIFISITTQEATFTLGSQYIPPSSEFSPALEELSSSLTNSRPLILGGDLNANSPLWGSPREDARGTALIEFLIINNLTLANEEDCPPTFLTNRAQGWPDFTIINLKAVEYINNWQVLDTHTASDHKYITFSIGLTPLLKQTTRFKSKFVSHAPFKKGFKSLGPQLSRELSSVDNTRDLDTFTANLLNSLISQSNNFFKKRNTSKKQNFSWWTGSLRTERNRLTALRRKLHKLPEEERSSQRTLISKLSAIFRKNIIQAKRDAWTKHCSQTKDKFGSSFKIYSGKFFTPDEVKLHSEEPSSKERTLKTLSNHFFGQTHTNQHIDLSRLTSITSPFDSPFARHEVRNALFSLNPNKAPGLDGIDFRILRSAFEALPQLFTDWANLCLSLGHFPACIKNGEVVYFLKQGKDASEPDSYRPICLLPTLSKFLEKLINQRLIYFLESNSLLHDDQFGFREGRSCETALNKLMSILAANKANRKYTTLISMDIKGAFDNVRFQDIVNRLIDLNCPENIVRVIASFLTSREVIINWGSGNTSIPLYKGCPQGSCLSPTLWMIIADAIIKSLSNCNFHSIVFADDFNFIFTGNKRLDIELQANATLALFSSCVASYGLQLSPQKTHSLSFSLQKGTGRDWRRCQKRTRNPTIRINGKAVKHVTELNLLGLTIDANLSWFPHISKLRLKVSGILLNSRKLASKTWGVSTFLLKEWYKIVPEKILTYAVGIWGNNLPLTAQAKLHSIQRPFLLGIARSYRTVSSEALNVMTGIPPLPITVQSGYLRARCLRFGLLLPPNISHNTLTETKVRSWSLHPGDEIPPHIVTAVVGSSPIPCPFNIFTDGSKSIEGVGAAFCVFKDNKLHHKWQAKLHNHNTVFQAEIYAIFNALHWLTTQCFYQCVIFSDSLSGLLAISSHRSTNQLIVDIKMIINSFSGKVRLQHVSAHKGIDGNEYADFLAKEATSLQFQENPLPLPRSAIISYIKENLITVWQLRWDYSDKGRFTYSLLPRTKLFNFSLIPAFSAFLSGHGPFPSYLHRFSLADSPDCPCGSLGDPPHYYFHCTLTKEWHLKKPQASFSEAWTVQVLSNADCRTKLIRIYYFLFSLERVF